MAESSNVELVRRALELQSAGAVDEMLDLLAPEFVHYGFDADGRIAASRGRQEMAELMHSGERLLASHRNELTEVHGVGLELVVAEIRSRAVARGSGETHEAEFVMVLQVRDGRIRWACDFIDSSIQDFLDKVWSSSTP